MPAPASCSSSFSTGIPSTLASEPTVTSDMCLLFLGCATGARCNSVAALTLVSLEPVLAGRHDQLRRALFVDAVEIGDLVGGELGEVVARHHAARGERVGGGLVHAVEGQQILGRLVFLDVFLDQQRLGEQRVAGTGAQLLDDVLVETL